MGRLDTDTEAVIFIWFFTVMEGKEYRYISADYETGSNSMAIERLEREYDVKVLDSIRQELTIHEYHGLLCSKVDEVDGGSKMFQAMLSVFYKLAVFQQSHESSCRYIADRIVDDPGILEDLQQRIESEKPEDWE